VTSSYSRFRRFSLAAVLALVPSLATPVEAVSGQATSRKAAVSGARSKSKLEARSALDAYLQTHPLRGGPLSARLGAVQRIVDQQGIGAAIHVARKLGMNVVNDQVWVLIRLESSKASPTRARLESAGLTASSVESEFGDAYVLVPLAELDSVARRTGAVEMRAPRGIRVQGEIVSEGVDAVAAPLWQQFDPPAGLPLERPVRVGIIDAGFFGFNNLLGDELPSTVTTGVFCADLNFDGMGDGNINGCGSTGTNVHGAAVAEIVHDLAPNAELTLATTDLSVDVVTQFEAAMDFMRSQDVDLVTVSLGSSQDNRDGSGTFCGAVDNLSNDGVPVLVASGNSGSPCEHEHYPFRPSAVEAGGEYGVFQSFPGKSDPILNEFILPVNQSIVIDLIWNHWDTTPVDDFDLILECNLGFGLEVVDASTDSQCGAPGSLPIETVFFSNPFSVAISCGYLVAEFDPASCPHRADVQLETFPAMFHSQAQTPACPGLTGGPFLEEATSSFSIGHPADCRGATAVGATCAFNQQLESFSSQGPTLDDRTKPEFCAPDNNSGNSFGISVSCSLTSGFPGTSAASPHLAGAVALLFEKIGASFNPEQCQEILSRRAIDINGDSTPDNQCGAGRLCMSSEGCN